LPWPLTLLASCRNLNVLRGPAGPPSTSAAKGRGRLRPRVPLGADITTPPIARPPRLPLHPPRRHPTSYRRPLAPYMRAACRRTDPTHRHQRPGSVRHLQPRRRRRRRSGARRCPTTVGEVLVSVPPRSTGVSAAPSDRHTGRSTATPPQQGTLALSRTALTPPTSGAPPRRRRRIDFPPGDTSPSRWA